MWNIKTGKPHIKVKLKNGIEYTANSSSDLWLKYIENSYKIKLNSRKGVGDWFSVFITNDYEFLQPENEVVIDIGGEVGDSAIYFSIKGAKKVIVFEPFPNNFKYLVENIKINNLCDKIEPVNAMLGKENKKTLIDVSGEAIVRDAHESNEGLEIYEITLSKIVHDYRIDNAVLKMDCEGCEYNLLSEDNEVLRKFKRIQIEYHYGYKDLVHKLRANSFKVKYTQPKKVYNKDAINPNLSIGYIYAER
jgi:FkbM family methyltransferase